MARSHLTLAALATAAVPGLEVSGASPIGSGVHGDFESALVTATDGKHRIIRIPTSERAESEQSADLVALRALSVGIRSRLPFAVSSFAGQTPVSGTRAVVYDFVYGTKVQLDRIPAGEGLAASLGRAIAAIHALPSSFVADAGLPVYSAIEQRRAAVAIMDRASQTGLVPAALLGRWEAATEDSALWQFAPTVINGSLTGDTVLTNGGQVTGVLGWHNLSVGDPARDLFWLLPTRDGVFETVTDAYQQARDSRDLQLTHRARLYSELELARWLLHGTQERSQAIIDDAVSMLHNLADRVHNDLGQTLGHQTMPVLTVDEVEQMLDAREA